MKRTRLNIKGSFGSFGGGSSFGGGNYGGGAVMTAADILAKMLTVDGVGSALDADLLDGQHGSYYAPIASPAFTSYVATPTGRTYGSKQSIKIIAQGLARGSRPHMVRSIDPRRVTLRRFH